jgi:catechol 2,3-dioxygenase
MFIDPAHVALQVPSLQESVDHYTQVLGLRELERRDGVVSLTYGPSHACVQLVEGPELALDHMAFAVADEEALGALHDRLEGAGVSVLDGPVNEPGVSSGIRFRSPTGHLFEAVLLDQGEQVHGDGARAMRGAPYPAQGVRPNRLGHLTAQTSDIVANVDFMTDVLGFKLSDRIGEEPWMAFGRCNNDHHALAFMQGVDGLHHLAFEVSSIVDLANLGDCLCEAGRKIDWGPGRHGAGDNIVMYHREPSGLVVEHYTDMQRIVDDRWQPRTWSLDDYRYLNLWGGPQLEEVVAEAVARNLAPERELSDVS